ncbi:MAG: arginine repressor, partial [Eubacteriales bacterium]
MKRKRHDLILQLIEKFNISTQEEMQNRLKNNGFEATQATVSRDIKELRLVKTMNAGGQYRYVANKTDSDNLIAKYNAIFVQSVISSDYAGNTI